MDVSPTVPAKGVKQKALAIRFAWTALDSQTSVETGLGLADWIGLSWAVDAMIGLGSVSDSKEEAASPNPNRTKMGYNWIR